MTTKRTPPARRKQTQVCQSICRPSRKDSPSLLSPSTWHISNETRLPQLGTRHFQASQGQPHFNTRFADTIRNCSFDTNESFRDTAAAVKFPRQDSRGLGRIGFKGSKVGKIRVFAPESRAVSAGSSWCCCGGGRGPGGRGAGTERGARGGGL